MRPFILILLSIAIGVFQTSAQGSGIPVKSPGIPMGTFNKMIEKYANLDAVKVIYVVLDDEESTPYNIAIKKAVIDYWTFCDYEFIKRSEVSDHYREQGGLFLMPLIASQNHADQSIAYSGSYTYINQLPKWDATTKGYKLSEMGTDWKGKTVPFKPNEIQYSYLIVMPCNYTRSSKSMMLNSEFYFAYAQVANVTKPQSYLYKSGLLVKMMDRILHEKKDKQETGTPTKPTFVNKEEKEKIKKNVLYIIEEELPKGVDFQQIKGKYAGKIEVIKRSEVAQKTASGESNYILNVAIYYYSKKNIAQAIRLYIVDIKTGLPVYSRMTIKRFITDVAQELYYPALDFMNNDI